MDRRDFDRHEVAAPHRRAIRGRPAQPDLNHLTAGGEKAIRFRLVTPSPYSGSNTSRGVEGPGPLKLRQPAVVHGGTARIDGEADTMASKAITSLDQWLTEAGVVLQESHEAALSPSQVASAEPLKVEWGISLGSFVLGLPKLLERMCSRPGRWILIAVDATRPHRYWQVMAFEDGSLVAEAGSGTASLPSERISAHEGRLLSQLGWNPPELPSAPNWRRVEATTSPDVTAVADQAARTLRDVYEIGGGDRLLLTMFPSPRRGGTPAGEQIPGDVVTLDGPAPRRGFHPTDEAWADYYRQMFPHHEHPDSAFAVWKYATTAVDVARTCWEAREKGRADWTTEYGNNVSAWPIAHPPFVLHIPQIYWAGCLGCTWVARSGPNAAAAKALAADHASRGGAQETTNTEERAS